MTGKSWTIMGVVLTLIFGVVGIMLTNNTSKNQYSQKVQGDDNIVLQGDGNTVPVNAENKN